MKKPKMRKSVSTLLIVAGIIVALIPVGARLYMSYQQKQMYKDYLESQSAMTEELSELDQALGEGNEETAAEGSRPEAMGTISISTIKCSLMLIEGSGSYALKWGAGHVTGTVMPGANGNCAIAGHRNSTFGSYFSRLGEVKIGDKIQIGYDGNTYNYKVYDIFVVDPGDVSVLKQGAADRPIVTLITCHPRGKNTHRLIVRGCIGEAPATEAELKAAAEAQAQAEAEAQAEAAAKAQAEAEAQAQADATHPDYSDEFEEPVAPTE